MGVDPDVQHLLDEQQKQINAQAERIAALEAGTPPEPPPDGGSIYDESTHRTLGSPQSLGPGQVLADAEVEGGMAKRFTTVEALKQGVPRSAWAALENVKVDSNDGAQGAYMNHGRMRGVRFYRWGKKAPNGDNAHGIYGKQLDLSDVGLFEFMGGADSYAIQVRGDSTLNAGGDYGGLLVWEFDNVWTDGPWKVNLGGGGCAIDHGLCRGCEFPGLVIVGNLNNAPKGCGPITFDGGHIGTLDLRTYSPITFSGGVTCDTLVNPNNLDTTGLGVRM